MSRQLAPFALALALTLTLAAGACAPDAPTAPAAASRPRALISAYVFSSDGYQPSVLPLRSAVAINRWGAIIGRTPDGKGVYYSSSGVLVQLKLPLTSTLMVHPVDLLDDGRIVATGVSASGLKALYYSNPWASPISIAGSSWATASAMNSQGVAVGYYQAPGARHTAFRWTPSGGLVEIAPAGCDESVALDISDGGHVVGWVECGSDSTGFRWNPGSSEGMRLPSGFSGRRALDGGSVLGRHPTIGSTIWWSATLALAGAGPNPALLGVSRISPNGRYVGSSTDPVTGQSRAWTSIGTDAPTFLPPPEGFSHVWATDVNACGTILGYGHQGSDATARAILWRRGTACDLESGDAAASAS